MFENVSEKAISAAALGIDVFYITQNKSRVTMVTVLLEAV
jgi:hypothetical protein